MTPLDDNDPAIASLQAETAAHEGAVALITQLPPSFGFLILVYRREGDGTGDDGYALTSDDEPTVDHVIHTYQQTRHTKRLS